MPSDPLTAIACEHAYDLQQYRQGSTALWTSYTYNILGQVTHTTFPDGSTATVSYNGLNITTTNSKGQIETRSYDLLGTLVSVIDNAGGVIRYSYDAMGNMTSVTDPAGNVTTMSYDIYGNRTVLDDKNLGTVTDDYNALGQLVSSTNAKGYTTSYTYDNLGRVLTRTEPDAQTGASVVTTYVYDGTYKYTRGKIISESNGVHSKNYTYNNKGLLTGITETIDNTHYRTRYSYDGFGRATEIIYPGGFRVKQTYRNGYVHQITSAGGDTTYYTCNDMTARGQVSNYRLGASLTVSHTFDATTGFLTQTTAGSIQDMRYQYDVLGNLTRRTNQKRNLYEDFTYDGLNRLTSSTVYNNGAQSRSVVVQYNNIGNITFKSDVGTYQYDAARPHAVVRIVNPLEDYQPLDYDVEYTSFDKVYRISHATQSVTFTYGTDQQRIKAVSVKSGQTTTKYYLGKLYEKEILPDGEVKENFYIFANSEVIALYTRSSKAANTRLAYCLRDHLGSLMYLVSPAGVVLEEYAYDPWGRRRDPLTWRPLSGVAPTARGFTGHEHIDLFELVNMDGRVYDPRLGRFLSPDPYVQDPTYSQSLNRYSYCVNNPLKYTDPTGYRTWWDNLKAWYKKHKNEIISTVVSIGVAVLVTALTGGIGSPLAVMLGGMAGGFTGGMVGARLNGARWSDAWSAAIQGMVIGGMSAVASFGIGSVISGSFASIGNATLQTIAREGTRALVHGAVQGYFSVMQGGSFWSGFASGAFSSAGGSLLQGFNLTERLGTLGSVGVGALMGGIAAELSGGDFGVGAISGAWVTLFNHMAHSIEDKIRARFYKTYAQMKTMREFFDKLPIDPLQKEILKLKYFYDQVKTGGPLDLKNGKFGIEVIGVNPVYFEGQYLTAADIGNYNYGIAAKAFGLSLEMAKLGAGFYQVCCQNGGDWTNIRGYFDFKEDTQMIIKGYHRY